jgi:hypothetical protein
MICSMGERHFGALLGAIILIAGCDGSGITRPQPPPDLRAFVTGAAADNLGHDGLFLLEEPVAPSSRAIIVPDRARDLAASYVRTFGPSLENDWERERGQRIAISGLKPDPRVFYASTPYEAFPEGFHPAFGTAFGPYYIVRMTSEGVPTLLVAVAAFATEVEIDGEGKIQRPPLRGNEFVSQGIPVDTTRPYLATAVTPEDAVLYVGSLTGARVSEVPELVRVGLAYGPLSSSWKLTLDRPVNVRTTANARRAEVRDLYVGPERGRRLMIPAAEQPSEYLIPALRVGTDGEDLEPETVRVGIKPDQPTIFEPVVIDSGQSN